MPRIIANHETRSASLAETAEAIAHGFDPQDEGSTAAAAAALAQLANNRDFLGDLLIDHLREHEVFRPSRVFRRSRRLEQTRGGKAHDKTDGDSAETNPTTRPAITEPGDRASHCNDATHDWKP